MKENKDEYIIKNVTLLASLIQATMWQFETISHNFDKNVKYKINMFKQYGYNMVDTINNSIKGEKEAEEYFDETTSDAIDIFKEYINCKNKGELLEIIKKYNSGELNVIRSK
jgi:hypothetical protein